MFSTTALLSTLWRRGGRGPCVWAVRREQRLKGLGRQSRNWGCKGTLRRTRDLLLLERARGQCPFVRDRNPLLHSLFV